MIFLIHTELGFVEFLSVLLMSNILPTEIRIQHAVNLFLYQTPYLFDIIIEIKTHDFKSSSKLVIYENIQ